MHDFPQAQAKSFATGNRGRDFVTRVGAEGGGLDDQSQGPLPRPDHGPALGNRRDTDIAELVPQGVWGWCRRMRHISLDPTTWP